MTFASASSPSWEEMSTFTSDVVRQKIFEALRAAPGRQG